MNRGFIVEVRVDQLLLRDASVGRVLVVVPMVVVQVGTGVHGLVRMSEVHKLLSRVDDVLL